jgi:carbon monoxide dehydrogenase subunit G
MKFNYDVAIDAPPDRVWAILSDIPRASGLMPNVQDVTLQPDGTYTGTVHIRVGPIGFNLGGAVNISEDRDAGRWSMTSQAQDPRIGGGVTSAVETTISEPSPGNTRMQVSADVQFSGKLGQLGQPLIKKKADSMVKEFTENLKKAAQD